jgi:hypothetical protein
VLFPFNALFLLKDDEIKKRGRSLLVGNICRVDVGTGKAQVRYFFCFSVLLVNSLFDKRFVENQLLPFVMIQRYQMNVKKKKKKNTTTKLELYLTTFKICQI